MKLNPVTFLNVYLSPHFNLVTVAAFNLTYGHFKLSDIRDNDNYLISMSVLYFNVS